MSQQIKSEKHKQSKRRRIYVFLICLMLSVFMWLIVVLNNEHSSSISITVVYKNTPASLKINRPLKTELSVEITGSGFELMKELWQNNHSKIVFDFDDEEIEVSNQRQLNAALLVAIKKQLAENKNDVSYTRIIKRKAANK